MRTKDELRSRLAEAELSSIAEELTKLSKECLRMKSQAASDDAPIGCSKLGGLPDVPPGFLWPTWKTDYLTFVAQLNLAELPVTGVLPTSGMLSFFFDRNQTAWGFDPNHKDGFRLFYFPQTMALARAKEPLCSAFPCALLSFEWYLSLPDSSSPSLGDLLLGIDDDEQYYKFVDEYAGPGPLHQALGWPHVIQNAMELECQLVTNGIYVGDATGYHDPRRSELESTADDWTLLLQFDSDDNARMLWGDCGMLYVWIRRQDLASRAFDRAWTILQCY